MTVQLAARFAAITLTVAGVLWVVSQAVEAVAAVASVLAVSS